MVEFGCTSFQDFSVLGKPSPGGLQNEEFVIYDTDQIDIEYVISYKIIK